VAKAVHVPSTPFPTGNAAQAVNDVWLAMLPGFRQPARGDLLLVPRGIRTYPHPPPEWQPRRFWSYH
jgi:hypothetical protein